MATFKKTKNDFQDRVSLNAGQKYCRMLQREHSAILSTFIKLPVVIKIFVLSIFEGPFYTVFTVPWYTARDIITQTNEECTNTCEQFKSSEPFCLTYWTSPFSVWGCVWYHLVFDMFVFPV